MTRRAPSRVVGRHRPFTGECSIRLRKPCVELVAGSLEVHHQIRSAIAVHIPVEHFRVPIPARAQQGFAKGPVGTPEADPCSCVADGNGIDGNRLIEDAIQNPIAIDIRAHCLTQRLCSVAQDGVDGDIHRAVRIKECGLPAAVAACKHQLAASVAVDVDNRVSPRSCPGIHFRSEAAAPCRSDIAARSRQIPLQFAPIGIGIDVIRPTIPIEVSYEKLPIAIDPGLILANGSKGAIDLAKGDPEALVAGSVISDIEHAIQDSIPVHIGLCALANDFFVILCDRIDYGAVSSISFSHPSLFKGPGSSRIPGSKHEIRPSVAVHIQQPEFTRGCGGGYNKIG